MTWSKTNTYRVFGSKASVDCEAGVRCIEHCSKLLYLLQLPGPQIFNFAFGLGLTSSPSTHRRSKAPKPVLRVSNYGTDFEKYKTIKKRGSKYVYIEVSQLAHAFSRHISKNSKHDILDHDFYSIWKSCFLVKHSREGGVLCITIYPITQWIFILICFLF